MKDNAIITLTSKPRKGGGDPAWYPPFEWWAKLKYGDETAESDAGYISKEAASAWAFKKYDELVNRDTYERAWRMKDDRQARAAKAAAKADPEASMKGKRHGAEA